MLALIAACKEKQYGTCETVCIQHLPHHMLAVLMQMWCAVMQVHAVVATSETMHDIGVLQLQRVLQNA